MLVNFLQILIEILGGMEMEAEVKDDMEIDDHWSGTHNHSSES